MELLLACGELMISTIKRNQVLDGELKPLLYQPYVMFSIYRHLTDIWSQYYH